MRNRTVIPIAGLVRDNKRGVNYYVSLPACFDDFTKLKIKQAKKVEREKQFLLGKHSRPN